PALPWCGDAALVDGLLQRVMRGMDLGMSVSAKQQKGKASHYRHRWSLSMDRRYRSADRSTTALPSRSITMSQKAPYTRSYSNGSTALIIRSMAEARSGM